MDKAPPHDLSRPQVHRHARETHRARLPYSPDVALRRLLDPGTRGRA